MKREFEDAPGVPGFKPVLRQWRKAIGRYNSQMGDDFAWHYHERACIGFLAAAAWLAGGVALEEWREDKHAGAERRKGRCDLYLYSAPCDLFIEAKHLWLPIGTDPKRSAAAVNRVAGMASRAAKELRCGRNQRRLGVAFVTPVIRASDKRVMTQTLDTFLTELLSVNYPAIAWTFDERLLLPGSRTDVRPGTILVAH